MFVQRGKDALLSLEVPEAADMEFKGWTPDPHTMNPVYQPGDWLPYDSQRTMVVLYAYWQMDPAKRPVVISFDANGGLPDTVPRKISAPQGVWVQLPGQELQCSGPPA